MSIEMRGGSLGTISNARNALSCIISIDCISFGQNQYVCRFRKGRFNNDPPNPKNDVTWNPDLVLNYIKIMRNNKSLTLLCNVFKQLFRCPDMST